MDLDGKAAIVTGASSEGGVGAACAKMLASRGCNVLVNYASNQTGAGRVVSECEATGVQSLAVQGDVAKDDDCRRLVQAAVDRWGRLDVLINNAAVTKTIPHRRFDLLDADEFERNYAVKSDRQLSDVSGGCAASQGDRRRGDREHLVDRRDAWRRQLDRLRGVQGCTQHADIVDGARARAGSAGQMRSAPAGSWAAGPAGS